MTQKKEKHDYRQEITDEIIRLIEAGTAPWQQPWDSSQAARLTERPYNAVTKRAYSGCNVLLLMFKSKALSSSPDPRWCTFLQAQENGWKIKAGSKGTTVEVWKWTDKEIGENETVASKSRKPAVFYYRVFHASQVEGIPTYAPPEKGKEWDPLDAGETILKNSGAIIKHDETIAFYRPASDEIHLPPKIAFPAAENYYQTALHELSHWTGHPSRLNRDLKNKFGNVSYAKEELRAEMASMYIGMATGIPFSPHNSASYAQSWLKSLKEDKHELFRAARDADKIADYVLDFARKAELIENATPETQEKLQAILRADMPENLARLTAQQEYIFRVQAAYIHNKPLSDENIAKELLLSGRGKLKVIDAITHSSPFADQTAGYAQTIVEKALTPEIDKAIRAGKAKRVSA
jgi:antirestriction protein ArdC